MLDVILDYKKGKGAFKDEYKSIMDNYWLNQILRKYKPEIAKLCGLEAAEIALDKIKSIINEDRSQFNYIWISTIEDHPQKTFPDRYEIQLVDFVRDMYELANPSDLREEVKKLSNEDHSIFKRIAVHIINYHYEDLKDLFWNWVDNPLGELFLKHEIYELLDKRCSSFSDKEIDKVLGWIDNKDFHWREEIKKERQKKERLEAHGKENGLQHC